MLPPPPVAIFPPAAAMLPRGPPQFAAPYPPPIFYWPYPSPPVSPTNYYNPANVGGIAAIPQQAALVSILSNFEERKLLRYIVVNRSFYIITTITKIAFPVNSGGMSAISTRSNCACCDHTNSRTDAYRRFPPSNGFGKARTCSSTSPSRMQSIHRSIHGVMMIARSRFMRFSAGLSESFSLAR